MRVCLLGRVYVVASIFGMLGYWGLSIDRVNYHIFVNFVFIYGCGSFMVKYFMDGEFF